MKIGNKALLKDALLGPGGNSCVKIENDMLGHLNSFTTTGLPVDLIHQSLLA